MIFQLLAAFREVRTLVGTPTRATELRAMLDAGDAQPTARASVIEAERGHGVEGLDAVAGSEFVDDRIHLFD